MSEIFEQHGAFSWFELMTTDVSSAKDFYTKLFGWTTEDMPMGEGSSYTVVRVGENQVAGIMALPPQAQGAPPMWNVYITVNDVNETAKKVEELGGKILMPPTDIPNVGRFCVIQDPQGAVICPITYVKM